MVTQKQALKPTRSACKRRSNGKLLKEKNLGYVVRSLEPIEAPLNEPERTGDLIPFASADVQNFKETESNQT
jgi:hypothetical protein